MCPARGVAAGAPPAEPAAGSRGGEGGGVGMPVEGADVAALVPGAPPARVGERPALTLPCDRARQPPQRPGIALPGPAPITMMS